MSKKSAFDEDGNVTETTEGTLTALTLQITEFLHQGTLDSRFAAKLTRRLKQEAEAILETGKAAKAGQRKLDKAFDMLDAALRDHDARLLVTANAKLRTIDNAVAAKRSQ
ncbi:hypothetical protein IQ288_20495 [Burkholderia sp. R-69980]|nr:hypothetical protein [Burkholderia sp. R-69980]